MLAAILILSLVSGSSPSNTKAALEDTKLGFRLSVGQEWDTNVSRTLDISNSEASGDLLTRLVSAARLHHRISPRHHVISSYVLGVKRFDESEDEDVIVQNLFLGTRHFFSKHFRLEADGRYRQSRMRSILRDYSLGRGELKLGWRTKKNTDYWISAGANRFLFPNETRLNYSGIFTALGMSGKLDTHLHWRVGASLEQQYYDGNALTTVIAPWNNQRIVTFCDETERRFGDDCYAPPREDSLILSSAKLTYQHLFILGAELQFQSRRSNSVYEDINRIRLSVFTTFELAYEIMVNALAAVQYTSEQSLSQNIFQYQPEDDENQNRVTLQLSRLIHGSLSALIRYELFTNAFATNDTAFIRQTVFGGLSFEIDR